MKNFKFVKKVMATTLAASIAFGSCISEAQAKDSFKVAWTIFAGWMPYDYAAASKIMDKWADKYNIKIEIVQVNDYAESINQYTAGDFDACTMASMDALDIPAVGGVDSTAVIIGDYSNGTDAILSKSAKSVKDLKGKNINLVELSVSHYLLARALEKNGMSEKDITVVNTSDSDMASAYTTDDVDTVVTWNPIVSEIEAGNPGTFKVFDSSNIPGEILDLTVVKTDVIKENPEFAKALAGAWYEIMGIMSGSGEKTDEALTIMAKAAGTDMQNYKDQIQTIHLFYKAQDAADYSKTEELLATMKAMAEFSYSHGLFGDAATSAEYVGIETPSGIYGDKNNIKLRFTPEFMQMAADGKL
ncbi:MAG: putative urea ABC transporter substrate-binding protein [Succinivibrio sp.]